MDINYKEEEINLYEDNTFLKYLKEIDIEMPLQVRNTSTFEVQYNKENKTVNACLNLYYYDKYKITISAYFSEKDWIFRATIGSKNSMHYCIDDIELKYLRFKNTPPFIIISYIYKWFRDTSKYYKEEESLKKINNLFPNVSEETKKLLNICLLEKLVKD